MKSFKKNIWGLAMIVGLLFLAACGSSEETTSNKEEKINVVTTIAQIGEPLSVIGGEHVNVESLMGPSVDPHLYNPTQSDISKVDSADLIFYNGLNLEVNMVDVFDSIGTEKPVLAIGDTLSEEQLLEDEEGAVDPHIWFDIDLWESALNAAVEELKEYAPEHADEFEANKQAYFEELDSLRESAEKLEEIPEEQRVLVTAHDAFGYFGNQHDMEVVGLQGLSTEGEIGVSDINETIGLIEEYKVPAIFVESSVNQDSINAVIEGASSNGVDVQLGGELFSDAMGEKGTDEGTYIGMYQHNIDTIHEALTRGDD
ncbi:zinc ABC transporter substrate-binding protein [Oceanobacillus kimchii]|uniref:metal ABC transporter solute-binding protein, Zn/Mn family n=1 Tax=Oceanobacillus kimchii TaxID=746691 RepID=UPI000349175C|nr:zinc ABC transporter substrate-binding protein [Oceanobacillus kimchii]MCT1577581.1 zinc ABC transporter substrate-binding protein [Oceanobacillus kimchii]MCT2136569.1 zinc ABC transporter substrate-binding protein [Oceanobacillus kimchii]